MAAVACIHINRPDERPRPSDYVYVQKRDPRRSPQPHAPARSTFFAQVVSGGNDFSGSMAASAVIEAVQSDRSGGLN